MEAEKDLYAANMQVASNGFAALGGIDPKSLQQELGDARPRPGGRDLRGFEWRHYWYLGQSDALARLPGHKHVVDATFFSPDGSRIATHSLDGNLRVWEAATNRQVVSLDQVAVPGGFTSDGASLIFSRPNSTIWRLEVATGKETQVAAASGRLLAALPDGRHVVVFGPDQLPMVRDLAATGVVEKSPDLPEGICAAISADGRRAAVSSPPGHPYPGLLVIELATHRQVAVLIDPRPVIALALSADGTHLVSAGFDGVLKVWDVDRAALERTFKAFLDPVWGMAYSADGRFFAAGGNNRYLKTWRTDSWEETEKLNGHTSTVRCIAFSPDGERLVSGSEDELALVWPAHIRRLVDEMPRLLRGPSWIDRTPGIAFSPDSRLFAGTAADGSVKIWRTDTDETVASFPMEARTVAFSPDGKSVLGEGYNGIVRRWALDGRQPVQVSAPAVHFANWQVDPLTPQERVALVADQPETRAVCRTCEISSARDGINAGAMGTTPTIAMSPDGKTMYVGQPSGTVEVWDVPCAPAALHLCRS